MLAMHAQVDGLTGLWNRRYFDSRWAEELSTANRHDRALSVALIDLDKFKSINDTFGHPAGDAVLEGFSKLVRGQHRGSDIPCRYGGEEIAIIMPETSSADAAQLCERIRVALADMTWPKHPERTVTASFGVAGASGTVGVDGAAWLEIADKNLYQAKTQGRNRVVTSEITEGGVIRLKAG
jgi:diguanylate cyclase (GGDEF)-like protein